MPRPSSLQRRQSASRPHEFSANDRTWKNADYSAVYFPKLAELVAKEARSSLITVVDFVNRHRSSLPSEMTPEFRPRAYPTGAYAIALTKFRSMMGQFTMALDRALGQVYQSIHEPEKASTAASDPLQSLATISPRAAHAIRYLESPHRNGIAFAQAFYHPRERTTVLAELAGEDGSCHIPLVDPDHVARGTLISAYPLSFAQIHQARQREGKPTFDALVALTDASGVAHTFPELVFSDRVTYEVGNSSYPTVQKLTSPVLWAGQLYVISALRKPSEAKTEHIDPSAIMNLLSACTRDKLGHIALVLPNVPPAPKLPESSPSRARQARGEGLFMTKLRTVLLQHGAMDRHALAVLEAAGDLGRIVRILRRGAERYESMDPNRELVQDLAKGFEAAMAQLARNRTFDSDHFPEISLLCGNDPMRFALTSSILLGDKS